MADVDSLDTSVWRRLLGRRRSRVLLGLVVLGLAIRIALPAIIRRVVVEQADLALLGRIELDDVDLALLTGGFTLHGLRVFATEAAPTVPAPAPSPTTATGAPASDAAPVAGEGSPGPAEYERPGHVAEDVVDAIAKWILSGKTIQTP